MPRPVIVVTSGADVDADHQSDSGIHRFPPASPDSSPGAPSGGYGTGVFGTGTFGV
jgi:hypothetical protein